MKFRIDTFTLLLLGAIVLATFLPATGQAGDFLAKAGTVAVALLFFFHGAALSREQIIAGATHWRLHILITALTFVFFPLVALPINELSTIAPAWMPKDLGLGFLYLGVLPSAVSSSIAYTAMARGNVPAAICSAAASNVFGMMLTPFLLLLLVSTSGGGDFSIAEALKDIVMQLLLPFALGHVLRPWIGAFIERHRAMIGRVDRGSILLVVYAAFSAAVVEGLWRKVSQGELLALVALSVAMLSAILLCTYGLGRLIGLSREDAIVLQFCGSKKSLASGVPMAGVLFPAAAVGPILLPVMIFHQIQLMACAWLARRYGARPPEEASLAPAE